MTGSNRVLRAHRDSAGSCLGATLAVALLALLACSSTPSDPNDGGARTGANGGATAGSGMAGLGQAGGAQAGAGGGSDSGNGGSPSAGKAGASSAGASGTGVGGGGGGPVEGAAIINDHFWKDTEGTPIYSQGGGLLQVGDTYYWYGVKYGGAVTYAADPHGKNSDISFQGITTYSSKDLVNWKHEATDKTSNAGGWFGRLGVAYNAQTKKYVAAAQGGGGLYFATSDKPSGGFVFDNVQKDLPGIVNGSTGDQTIFQDDDGQAYLISSSSSGRANRYVSPLRAADFLAAEEAIFVYKGGGREGNCMFKYAGRYYHCSSDLHGWNTSQTYCVSASNIKGPYGAEFVMKGTERDYSHVTQTGFFFNVTGSKQTTVVFAGDRWADFAGNGLGFNQWMPLSFEGDTPFFHSLSAWTVNTATGEWRVAPGNNWILNPSFEADRIAVTTPVGWTAKSSTNVKDARNGNWGWQLKAGASITQRIDSLPSGKYTLSAWVKASAAGATLEVTGHGGATANAEIPTNANWGRVDLAGIIVSTARADVTVVSAGPTVTIDDLTLTAE
jgi:hypothetical protein